MDQIKLGAQSAFSHSWHNHSKSLMSVRAITSLVNGIKAYFGGYCVSALHCITTKLMKEHPDAWFTKTLHKPLSAYNINIPLACERSTRYVFNKIKKLHNEERELQVKLAFKRDGSALPIPIYNSDNLLFPKNLNGQVRRSVTDTKAPGQEILCRHLAWAYAKKVFGRGKDTFKTINTSEKIQLTFANTPDDPLRESYYLPVRLAGGQMTKRSCFADLYYFHKGKFSAALTGLVEKYWNMSDSDEKNFFFRSREHGRFSHSMALRLKKQNGCMKVIFYDPNATLRHKTFLLSEPGLAAYIAGEDLQASFLSYGVLMNIDDRKKSYDESDIQSFGGSLKSNHLMIEPGRETHAVLRR
ncbi:ShET2/EspL2 family type III secretion system effector toxin [Endozoicomonas sp. 8E]|uniref:ShET2/EspL2 family type III secretion system effector toxin n=1 Tax=Endozoicomonas sp. 8E TaxID=3035692 RepID=UPI0029394D6C|nr:ShET2/EspL2 family type III secretion system effector toxin [Endozoicomonas sp. 8E]WOG26075.1 ShET2/EspL2 family type III secretion system effector toxin [Endozoicomonas sp. 8E]